MIVAIWSVAVLIQVVITIILASQFAKKSHESYTKPEFSIIIAAHNELGNLKTLIPKLLEQQYPSFEITVALDRCSDNCESYLKELNDSRINIRVINQTKSGWNAKKWALNEAINSSRGDWLVFTDADCYPVSSGWLDKIASTIKSETDIVIGYSPYQTQSNFLSNFIQYEAFVTAFNYLSMALIGQPYMSVGRNMAIKKSFFMESGGYGSIKAIKGGDDDLFIQQQANRKNTSSMTHPNSIVFTYPKDTWKDYLQQKTRHLSVGSKYKSSDIFLHFLFNASLLLTWLLLWFISYEIVLPIILFYLSIKWIGYRFAASKMGVGFNYIWLPLVDFLYALIIPIIALRSKLVKDIQWKKN